MTKKDLENYRYLRRLIEQDEKKLQHYKDNPPCAIHGKVQASNQVFPYQPISVEVSGPDIADRRAWKEKQDVLMMKLHNERVQLEQSMLAVDEFLLSIEDARDRLVIEYMYHDGMTQDEIGKKMYIDQSTVAKIVNKYLKKQLA